MGTFYKVDLQVEMLKQDPYLEGPLVPNDLEQMMPLCSWILLHNLFHKLIIEKEEFG